MVDSRLEELRREIRAFADPDRAVVLQRFFKTGPGEYAEGDRFLGVRVPQVRQLVRRYRDLPIASVLDLLASEWHEERLLALLLLVEQYRRGGAAERQAIYETYLANRARVDNWDLVDSSAPHLVGAHLDPADLSVLEELARSSSVWDRRISVIATQAWIRRRIAEPTYRIAEILLHDPHDLIHKAVGWMLRETGKPDPAGLHAFLRRHQGTMPRTMLRYAIEHYPPEQRARFLRGVG